MIRNDTDLLRLMMRDEEQQSDLYRPGPYWRGYQHRTLRAIERLGIENFRRHPEIGKGFADTIAMSPLELETRPERLKHKLLTRIAGLPKVKKLVRGYRELLDARTGHFLTYRSLYYDLLHRDWLEERLAEFTMPETLAGGSVDAVEIGGQRYALVYIRFLLALNSFERAADFTAMRSVMEIGGGFGAFMHLLLSRHDTIRKVVYLDIPPMIYLATQYLKSFFNDAVRDYRQTRESERIGFADNDDLEILCLCPWQIEHLDLSLDMLWNFSSFSEMPPAIVNNYAAHFKRLAGPEASVCLNMNKLASATTSSNEQVLGAFSDMFRFSPVEPLSAEGVINYHLGRRARG